jgi:hypothetical protein
MCLNPLGGRTNDDERFSHHLVFNMISHRRNLFLSANDLPDMRPKVAALLRKKLLAVVASRQNRL